MALSANELIEAGDGWHTGQGTITYSYIGSDLPSYYVEIDTNSDGIDDSDRVGDFHIPFDEDGVMTLPERGMVEIAIQAWNEVANVNLVHGNATSGNGGTQGSPVRGNGNLVSGLGGASGYGEIEVPRNDDGYMNVDISAVFEDGLDFFSTNSDGTDVYVNTNGNITLGQGLSTFTPSSISNQLTALIAPFWGDVDTRADSDPDTPDSAPIYVDINTNKDIVTFTWANVGYYSQNAEKTNSFQLQLFDRGGGDFDIVFRYDDINWTTGNASGGTNGLGGTPAFAGYTAGDGSSFFELPQSSNQGAILNLDQTTGNTGKTGLWVFEVRDGAILGDITFGSLDTTTETDGDVGNAAGFTFVVEGSTLATPDHGGDVWIGDSQSTLEPGHSDYLTFIHEIGHALGLSHPGNNGGYTLDNSQTVMSYNPHPSVVGEPLATQSWPITPMVLDISELQSIYGANFTTRNTDTIYFGNGANPNRKDKAYQYGADDMLLDGRTAILTIWDAGGTDLIDASDVTKAAVIDLRPGHYSTIGAVENNIAVASAVTKNGSVVNLIENATGTGLGDSITGNQAANVLRGGGGKDTIDGAKGKDSLFGNEGKDVLKGGAGNDEISGGDGNDKLKGGKNNDTIRGGQDNDSIWGDQNADRLFGDAGEDKMSGGNGKDFLDGGDNNDSLKGGAGNDTLKGGKGADLLYGQGDDDKLEGGIGKDSLIGGAGNDTLKGEGGNDLLYGRGDHDLMNGGAGSDTLRGEDGKDTLNGGAESDLLEGGAGRDELSGGAGRDKLRGGDHGDILNGNVGKDTIAGNDGADTINGGVGNDKLRGGGGNDTFVFEGNFGKDLIYAFEANNNMEDIDLSGVTSITGFSDLSNNHMTQSGNHVLINAGGGNEIYVLNTDLGDLGAADFLF